MEDSILLLFSPLVLERNVGDYNKDINCGAKWRDFLHFALLSAFKILPIQFYLVLDISRIIERWMARKKMPLTLKCQTRPGRESENRAITGAALKGEWRGEMLLCRNQLNIIPDHSAGNYCRKPRRGSENTSNGIRKLISIWALWLLIFPGPVYRFASSLSAHRPSNAWLGVNWMCCLLYCVVFIYCGSATLARLFISVFFVFLIPIPPNSSALFQMTD